MNMRESLDQILASDEPFGDIFYDVFFACCPEAPKFFTDVDMKRQGLVLTMALTLVEQYHSRGYPAIKQYLQHLGTRHDDYGVPRELFDGWRDSMLKALARFHGAQWNDELAAEWSDAILAVSEVMFHGYDHRVGM